MPTDAQRRNLASAHHAEVQALNERISALSSMSARLKQEAQAHAMEARTANATIAEIYRVCSGGTGEPGNWHGAEPVRERIAALEAQVERCRKETESLVAAACTPLLAKIVDMEVEQAAQPVTHQFQARDGSWHGFVDERHIENTIKDGSWPIRQLCTAPPKAVPLTDQEVVGYHYSKMSPFGQVLWHVDYAVHPDAIEWFPLVRGAKGITPATVEKCETP